MALAASTILTRVSTTLLDPGNVNWTQTELLDYLNAGINACVANKPDVSAITTTMVVTNAQAKQTIPNDGLQLLDVIRNVSATSTPIREIDRNHLNNADLQWPNRPTNATQEIMHFMYDVKSPLVFYIYPQPASGVNTIEIQYCQMPARLTSSSQNIPIADIFENALHHFTCAYAYAKNSKRTDLTKAEAYFNLFSNAINARSEIQYKFSPFTPRTMPQTPSPTIGGVEQ